ITGSLDSTLFPILTLRWRSDQAAHQEVQMTQFKDKTLLVTGAAGHLGRLAVAELLDRGATRVVPGTRDPAQVADLAARGVEVRRLDFDDAASMQSGFAGIDRALVISTVAPNRTEQQTNAVAAARAAGV